MRLAPLVAWLIFSTAAFGADFSTSSIAVNPDHPVAGDVVIYDIALRTGGETVPWASVTLELDSALVLDISGDCAAKTPGEPWIILDWPVGTEQVCRIEALSFVHDAGANARLSADIQAGAQFWRVEAAPMLDAPTPSPQLFSGMLLALVAALLAGAIIWTVRLPPRQRRWHAGTLVALALPSIFLLFFVDLAWRDGRAAFAFIETGCTVVGATLDIESFSSAIRRTGRSQTATPLLALRYAVNGEMIHALGFAGPSHALIGGGGGAAVAAYALGDVVPCRYDPMHPRTVLVRWEPGLAYLFALLPLALFLLGLVSLRGAKSR